MDCINMAVGEQGGIELRRLFGVAIEPQAWGYARHVNFPPKSERRGGPGGSLLSYHCGDRPRACGRRERERARTQIGTEQNATALPSRTLPKSAARLSPPKEREFHRTWSPSIAEVCYRRRGPAAAPMNADADLLPDLPLPHHRQPSAVVPRLPTKSSDWADSGRSVLCGNSSSCATAVIHRRRRGGSKPRSTERRLNLPRQ